MHLYTNSICVLMLYPLIVAVPPVGGYSPVRTLISVVLPAPFGPNKPNIMSGCKPHGGGGGVSV